MKITIKQGDKTQLSPHFRASEFYTNSPNPPASHEFPSELVEAAEFLRTYYNVPWRITSTYRTPKNELRICEVNDLPLALATTSQHVLERAFDSQPAATPARNAEIMLDLADQFLTAGPVFKALRKLGVRGFGIYPTFIHLDVRIIACKHRDEFGTFAAWDDRKGVKKKIIGAAAWNPTLHTTNKAAAVKPTSLPS